MVARARLIRLVVGGCRGERRRELLLEILGIPQHDHKIALVHAKASIRAPGDGRMKANRLAQTKKLRLLVQKHDTIEVAREERQVEQWATLVALGIEQVVAIEARGKVVEREERVHRAK